MPAVAKAVAAPTQFSIKPPTKPVVAQAAPVRPAPPAKSSKSRLFGGIAAAVVIAAGAAGAYFGLADRTTPEPAPQPSPVVAGAQPASPTGTPAAPSPTTNTAVASVTAMSAPAASASATASITSTAPPTDPGSDLFFHDGQTDWRICLSPESSPTEQFAAEELSEGLRKISGANFLVDYTDEPPARRVIILGDLKTPAVKKQAAALKLQEGPIEQLAVYTLGDQLYLAGNQPRGVLYAVYHFLQQDLGVRWLWPGPDGEFMPAKKTWSLPKLQANHRPVFTYRGFHLCGDWRDVDLFRQWMGRNFINIYRHAAPPEDKRRGFYSMFSDHNAALPEALFAEHPEYFSEIKGTRYKTNICFSNPEVEKLVLSRMTEGVRQKPHLDILSIFPADNEDYCRCAECAKTDVSTAWFQFYNRVTDALKKEFPKLKFATIAYQGYRTIPQCAIRNTDFIEYASYSRCNMHPYGHPDCRQNDETLAAMRAWKATGVPIGNYTYEYDIYSQNRRFAPFFTMIADAVKTSRALGHVSVIPEVLLHPKTGPDEQAAAIQNRLSIYLYARLLWNPDQPLEQLLADWCRTVYGDAAAPMLEYFTALDRHWTAMPLHTTILGNALRTVPVFMTDEVRQVAEKAFSATETKLATIADLNARERAAAALARERALFNQWQDLYRLNNGAPQLSLPLLAAAADFPQTSSRPQEFAAAGSSSTNYTTRVRLAWTDAALLVHWTCNDPKIKSAKAVATERDGKVLEDDGVELELTSGATGETWHLAVNTRGTQYDRRRSSVGVDDERWNPDWQTNSQTTADGWEATMIIPFAALGRTPNPAESWQARFLRHNGGRKDFAAANFPERDTASLLFSSSSQADRTLLWWAGSPEKEGSQNAAITQEFTAGGWQIQLLSEAAPLAALKQPCDAYWFRHANGPNKVPADFWSKHLVPAVKNGATAVFVSFLDTPLDEYFGDPTLKLKLVTAGAVPLAGRTTASLADGEWSKQPHDLQAAIKKLITPAYGFEPADPSKWTVLATANGAKGPFPYLLARRYGKGLIVVVGAELPLPRAKLLDNLMRNQSQMP